jgi:hypothetical protein
VRCEQTYDDLTMSTFFGPSMTVIPGPTEETLVALIPRGVLYLVLGIGFLIGWFRGRRSASESIRCPIPQRAGSSD